MEQLIIDFVTKYPWIAVVVTLLMAGHGLALAIVAMTSTPTDDSIVAKVYKGIEWLAGVVGRAKEKGSEEEKK